MASNTNNKKLHIAIIGGGIGGLTFGVALKGCSNIQVDLYEQAHRITEIGTGITVWPRTWEILKSLGLEEQLKAQLPEEPDDKPKLAFEFRLSDRREGFTFHKLFVKNGALGFHRQSLQATLLKNLPDFCTVHLEHHVNRIEESEGSVKLFFRDGSEATCDILVGADGVKSVAREKIPNKGVFWTGTMVYRGVIPREMFAKMYPGHRAINDPITHVVTFPISNGQLINVAASSTNLENEGKPFDPVAPPITKEEILETYSGWEEEVMQLLGCLEKPTHWVLRDLHPLSTYITRRIALLGDAAHAMEPNIGAGAGQAIEDAYVLGTLFRNASTEDWARVLEAYNAVRQPFATMIRNNAREQGFYYELNSPELKALDKGQVLTPDQLDVLRRNITKNYSWWEDDADIELQRAVKLFNKKEDEPRV
ncbi:hypothetical protein GYMLUDRAFT_69871 [Collybiopsis luxurians FD-317 M1]|nr:hypothetical protein GYMLUDRAFT_69871 [Collybiopsis luxurians FD-317 M1]